MTNNTVSTIATEPSVPAPNDTKQPVRYRVPYVRPPELAEDEHDYGPAAAKHARFAISSGKWPDLPDLPTYELANTDRFARGVVPDDIKAALGIGIGGDWRDVKNVLDRRMAPPPKSPNVRS